jgi:hypothetical protein
MESGFSALHISPYENQTRSLKRRKSGADQVLGKAKNRAPLTTEKPGYCIQSDTS